MVATPAESRAQQARTGALTQLLIRQLVPQLTDGMPAVEYIAACIAAQRLGHETAAADMAAFITEHRRRQAPGRDMPAPVLAEFPERLAAWRAWRTATAVEQARQERIPPEQADTAARLQAEGAFRDTLGAGRDTLLLSAHRAGTRWRRMTGPSPCAFCAMLAGRSDYTTRESAVTIVGRRGRIKKGGRPAGSKFHGHCTCTAVEVLGSGDSVQQGWRDAYDQAVQECRDDGVEPTTANVLARMRAQGGFSDSPRLVSSGSDRPRPRPVPPKPAPATARPAQQAAIPPGSALAKAIGDTNRQVLDRYLASTPHKATAELWLRHVDAYRIATTTEPNGRAYYRPATRTIHLDLAKAMARVPGRRPGENIIHECGHALDHLLGDLSLRPEYTTALTRDFEVLAETHREAASAVARARLGRIGRDAEAGRKIQLKDADWLHDRGVTSSWTVKRDAIAAALRRFDATRLVPGVEETARAISADVLTRPPAAWLVDDMMEAAYGDAYPARFGHGAAYWRKSETRRWQEAFAEMVQAQIANPEAWAAMRTYFPTAAAAFERLVKEALNG